MFCLSKTQQVIEDLFRMPVFEKKNAPKDSHSFVFMPV